MRQGRTVFIIEAAMVWAAQGAWHDNLQPSLDLRYRVEYTENDTTTQQRDRIRIRLGVVAPVNDQVNLGVRVTTSESKGGEGNPLSHNQTLSNFGTKKALFLDLAYFDWKPEQFPGLQLTAGKMNQPFICVNDHLWDNDYTPEGVALQWESGDSWKVYVNAACTWLQERANDDDSKLFGGQIAVVSPLVDHVVFTLGVSVYQFTEVEGHPVFDWAKENRNLGNSVRTVVDPNATNVVYATDFLPLEGFGSLKFEWHWPVTIFGAWVQNPEADEDNQGWTVGFRVGQLWKPGSVQFGYDYRRLERDVTVGAFTDADSFGGGTDGHSHRLALAVQVLKNFQMSAQYFIGERRLDDPKDYQRFQFDVLAKF
jgi:hypothetical protein